MKVRGKTKDQLRKMLRLRDRKLSLWDNHWWKNRIPLLNLLDPSVQRLNEIDNERKAIRNELKRKRK